MADIVQARPTVRRSPAAIVTALVVSALATLVAANGIVVTAGGNDQRDYHWKTVDGFGKLFPHVDIIDVQTATAPLYHLIVAAVSAPLHLGEAGAEVVGSVFAAALAAVAVWYAWSVPDPVLRALAIAPLLLSPYFWQSALWMLNDAAALLFGFLALIVALRQPPDRVRTQLAAGLLLAAAVATRQTMVWALVPVLLLTVAGLRDVPAAARGWAIARIALPPLVVVAMLAILWHGLVPPPFQEINAATRSWVSPSYCAAAAAVFFTPVLAATGVRRLTRPGLSAGLAVVAALPAMLFPSAATEFPDDSRRGGFIWSVVAHTPSIGGRSVALAALAFVGCFVVCQLVAQLDPRTALVAASALISVAAVLCAGGQLYPKYVELPVAALTVIVICALAGAARIRDRRPLAALAALQLLLTAGIVGLPILHAVS